MPEDAVADLELGDCGADGVDLAGELAAGDPAVGRRKPLKKREMNGMPARVCVSERLTVVA